MFQVRFYNENQILDGRVYGKIRHSFIRILPGDKVKKEVNNLDSSRGL